MIRGEEIRKINKCHVLTTEDCDRAGHEVDRIKDLWEPFGNEPANPNCYLIPTAMYLLKMNRQDYCQVAKYLKIVAHCNPHLKRHFGWLYEKVGQALSELYNQPFCLSDEAGYPGFHLFHRPFSTPGTLHFDLQFTSFPWRRRSEWNPETSFSFTLAIELPKNPAGLYLWDAFYTGPLRDDLYVTIERKDLPEPEVLVYQPGTLFTFSSFRLHQVVESPAMQPHERRLTLQGQALQHRDGHWIMYF